MQYFKLTEIFTPISFNVSVNNCNLCSVFAKLIHLGNLFRDRSVISLKMNLTIYKFLMFFLNLNYNCYICFKLSKR